MPHAPAHAARRPLRALVIFGHESDWPICRLLKPNFRHCALAVNDGRSWVLLQNIQRLSDIRVVAPAHYDLPRAYEILGCPTVAVTLPRLPTAKRARRPRRNCVSAIKAMLGIEAWWIVTPYQLYRHLRSR